MTIIGVISIDGSCTALSCNMCNKLSVRICGNEKEAIDALKEHVAVAHPELET